MKSIRKYWAYCFIFIFILSTQLFVDKYNTFISDSLLKAVQSESIYKNNFQDESLQSNSSKWDPEFQAFPFTYGIVIGSINGKIIGQYPVTFSIINAALLSFGCSFSIIIFFYNCLLFLAIVIFSKKLNFSQFTTFLFYFAGFIFLSVIDLNETALFLSLNLFGFSIWMDYRSSQKNSSLFWATLFISFSIWFRLESLLFLFSLILSEVLTRKENNFRLLDLIQIKWLIPVSLGILPIIAFFLYNLFQYSHFLGPRYFFNFSDQIMNPSDRIIIILSILFTYWKDTLKLGFFLLSGYLIFPLFQYFRLWREISLDKRFLLLVCIFLIISISFNAPNDGVTIHGRYFLLLYLPAFALWNIWANEYKNSSNIIKYSKIILISVSLILNLTIFLTFLFAIEQERKYRNYYSTIESDLTIYTNDLLCGLAGLNHLQKNILCFHENTDFESIIMNIENDQSVSAIAYYEPSEKFLLNSSEIIIGQPSRDSLMKIKASLNKSFKIKSEEENEKLKMRRILYTR